MPAVLIALLLTATSAQARHSAEAQKVASWLRASVSVGRRADEA